MVESSYLHLGALLYASNLLVGVSAQWGRTRWGALHHLLYALVFVSALGAALVTLHPGLGVTLTALAALPFTRGGSVGHPLVAAAGGLGYLCVYLS
jgi:hypothetical protein